MKRHQILGTITALLGLPIVLSILILVYVRGIPVTSGLVIQSGLVAAALFAAGSLLWSSRRLMQWVACGLWILVVAWSVLNLVVVTSVSWITGYLVAGILIVAYLAAHFRRGRHAP
jgi:hypothetical protein